LSGEFIFLLVVAVIVTIVAVLMHVGKNRDRIMRSILNRLNASPEPGQLKGQEGEGPFIESNPDDLAPEESKAELERLQTLIEDRKQLARDTDLSHHLWGLYKILLRYNSPDSSDHYLQDGEWFEVKILKVSTENDLNKLEFELKGDKYTFVDDEETQGWSLNMKTFSLFLYDDSNRCLIEIPMKLRVDSSGRNYSVASGGPQAFLAGDWIKDFINVKLKHQSIRNQEIRAQKHQERLREIEDLKGRFGIRE
jgi:hypothetical protein